MDTKLLSIIIPTYNMEKYLPRCLDSLLIKENLNLLEIWVVNDGSKDNSSEIAHQYADKYPGVFHVIDKPNGNYGSCINAALKVLTGKYVKVLDSDDYFNTDALINIIKRLKEANVDVILTDFTVKDITVGAESLAELNLIKNKEIELNQNEIPQFEMHAIIYKSSLLKDISYQQTEGISYTDTEWTFYPMLKAKNLIYFKENLYQYIMGREGQTVGFESFCRNIEMMEQILIRILDYLKQEKKSLSPCHRHHAEDYIKIKLWAIYYNELIRRNKTNIEFLTKVDEKCKLYDISFYKSLQKPFLKKYYIVLFRSSIYVPIFLRRLSMKLAHIVQNRRKKRHSTN